MAVKFILTLVLLQLVSAAPGPDPEPDPDVNVVVNQNVDVSCGCSKCPCDKDEPEPTTPIGDAHWCDDFVCNGTCWNSPEIRTGVCAPSNIGYKGWFDMTIFGEIESACSWQPPPHEDWTCNCYINGCSNCSCTVNMHLPSSPLIIPVHGICADHSWTGPIPQYWTDNGHGHGCQDCSDVCRCYTPPW